MGAGAERRAPAWSGVARGLHRNDSHRGGGRVRRHAHPSGQLRARGARKCTSRLPTRTRHRSGPPTPSATRSRRTCSPTAWHASVVTRRHPRRLERACMVLTRAALHPVPALPVPSAVPGAARAAARRERQARRGIDCPPARDCRQPDVARPRRRHGAASRRRSTRWTGNAKRLPRTRRSSTAYPTDRRAADAQYNAAITYLEVPDSVGCRARVRHVRVTLSHRHARRAGPIGATGTAASDAAIR